MSDLTIKGQIPIPMCLFLFLQHSERLISKNYFNFMSYKYKHFFFHFPVHIKTESTLDD